MLGVFFMNLAIEHGVVHVRTNNNIRMHVNLTNTTEKVLVPRGQVTNPTETEEIHISSSRFCFPIN